METSSMNVILCCVFVVSLINYGTSCDMPATEKTSIWIKETKNKAQTVIAKLTETSAVNGSSNEIGNDTHYKQMEPIYLQSGLNLRVILPQAFNQSVTGFFQTNLDSFINCGDSNITRRLLTIGNNRSLSIDSSILITGTNYLQADSKDECEAGWRLKIIIIGTNDCHDANTETLCSDQGICAVNDIKTTFTCKCCSGFQGKYCEQEEGSTDLCAERPCLNGGTCVAEQADDNDDTRTATNEGKNSSTSLTTRCVCNSHFAGPQCETRLDHCKSNPCIHGVCVEKIDGYQCYCIPGFHGRQCQLEYDECICNPCHHHGTCVDRLDRYECRCSPGYTGPNCQTKVDLCHNSPCHMNGTCIDLGNTFMCNCPQGFTGTYCEKRVNKCVSAPCQNHGTCIDLENGFQCLCPITFAGVHCEYMMDVFAPPLEGSDLIGRSHAHNLYIVAGTLSGAIVVILVVLAACYCKMHETYRQISWRRLRTHHRSLSCPDFDACNEIVANGKHRLSVDAICEATSLAFDNGSMDTNNHQHLMSPKI